MSSDKGNKTSISVGGNVGGDVVGGDKIGGDKVGGDKIVGAAAAPPDLVNLEMALAQWKQAVEAKINAPEADLDEDDKEYLMKTVAKVETEASKGPEADPAKLESFFERLTNMAPDILEVTAKTLQNPFAGVGLVLEKINNRIKLEKEQQAKG
jgi:hypothetical protein